MRTISSVMRTAMYGPYTTEKMLDLIDITHADITGSGHIRLVANHEDVSHDGHTWTACGVRVVYPDDTEDGPREAELEMCTVGRTIDSDGHTIIEELRLLTTPPTITLIGLLESRLDQSPEIQYSDLEMARWVTTPTTITATLSHEDTRNEPWPAIRKIPARFPGLFAGEITEPDEDQIKGPTVKGWPVGSPAGRRRRRRK